MARISSLRERPRSDRPRRLADWLNPTGEQKVHSLVDKVYQRKNVELAWEKVKQNRGAGGVDGQSMAEFEEHLDENLQRLHDELRTNTYHPHAVLRHLIPKAGQPGKYRPLGIPTIYDRVYQQALLNRLEPIFDAVFDDANFGYRRGRSTKDALRKIWREIQPGISILPAPDGTFIHPRAADPTKLSSSHNRPAPEAVTSAPADVQPTGAPYFQGIPQIPLHTCGLSSPGGLRCTRRASACRDR